MDKIYFFFINTQSIIELFTQEIIRSELNLDPIRVRVQQKMMIGKDRDDLPKNGANYTALTPLWFIERAPPENLWSTDPSTTRGSRLIYQPWNHGNIQLVYIVAQTNLSNRINEATGIYLQHIQSLLLMKPVCITTLTRQQLSLNPLL